MNCPNCGSGIVTIVDSRQTVKERRRRRYRCDDCGDRFTTYELHEESLKDMEELGKTLQQFLRVVEKWIPGEQE